jgi:cytochrome c oxidase subunit I
MSTPLPIVSAPQQESSQSPRNYLNVEHGLKSWLLTVDHKRIAILYLISVSFFFVIGGLLAMAVCLELLTPLSDLMAPDTYNKVFTMHGIVMVFFVLIPAIPAVLGNFVLPMMLGARDLAFPKINLLSWYCGAKSCAPSEKQTSQILSRWSGEGNEEVAIAHGLFYPTMPR